QHPELDRVNPSCVNTLRICTLRQGGDVKIYHVALRMGHGRTVTDNLSIGGLIAGVDPETGRVDATAKLQAGAAFTHHPTTGAEFASVIIPHFAESIDLAISAHRRLGLLHSIGWDICVQEDGPTLIEGNHNWGEQIPQGTRYPAMRETYVNSIREFVAAARASKAGTAGA
ncbi:MAG: hypothetical protein D6773_03355, partial [Alphaproteobacteria bacterium]